MMTWSQLSLQDACSPIMEEMIFFHDFTVLILTLVMSLVWLNITFIIINKFIHFSAMESQALEYVWTIVPAIVLIEIAFPSLILLYMIDETSDSALTLKVVGHQWYWSYEYSDFWLNNNPIEFDSYMLKSISKKEPFRLLDTDNRLVLPMETSTQILVSSSDVLHSWTIPSFGIKADACPGRLNQMKLVSFRPGLFFGQCSEICGANHSFMPIALEVVSSSTFLNWVSAQK